jgi:tetratricopeptide (TPR) repeat protein
MALAARFSFFVALCALCLACRGQSSSDRRPIVDSQALRQLQTLLDRQQQATSSQNPDDVVASSQALTGFALRQLKRVDVALKQAPSSPSRTQNLRTQEHQLRQILANGFNDWGTAEAKRQQFGEALHRLQQAEQWDASTPGLMRNLGTAAFQVENYNESARALERVVSTTPEDKRSRLMLAMSQFSLERFAEAAKNFAAAGDLTMQDTRAAYAWAYSLVRTNQPQQANAIADILRTRSLPQDIRLLVCKLYTASESFELAIPCLRTLVQENPTMLDVHYELGATLIRLNKPSEAIPELRAELAIDSKDIDAQYDLAYSLLETSQKEEAIRLLRSVLTANPNYTQAQYQLGKVLLEGGKSQEAIEHLEIAARLNPANDFVHYQLQVAYRRVGRTEDANRELQRYKELKAAKRE